MGLFDEIRKRLTKMFIYGIPVRTHTVVTLWDIHRKAEEQNCVIIKWKPTCLNRKTDIINGWKDEYFYHNLN